MVVDYGLGSRAPASPAILIALGALLSRWREYRGRFPGDAVAF
jgi:hypothetical protein